MSLVTAVRETNERLSTDDARPWAEVLGVTLALGFFVRDYAHVLSALLSGVDPQLRGSDVTSRSPVASLDDDTCADLSARLLAVAFGLVVVFIATLSTQPLATAYLVANAVVPLADPILFASTQR